MKYENPFWEPVFRDISPTLAWLYFHTTSGRIRYFLAGLIFWKLDWLERRAGV